MGPRGAHSSRHCGLHGSGTDGSQTTELPTGAVTGKLVGTPRPPNVACETNSPGDAEMPQFLCIRSVTNGFSLTVFRNAHLCS